MPPPGQIFFSYSRVDAKFALKLGEDLRKAGVDIWIDQIDIPPSEPWDEVIAKALDESDRLLVILSHTSVASDNVLNEINYALESKKQVLPILIEKNIKKPFNIGRLQHIDFTDSYGTGLTLLLKSLSLGSQLPLKERISYRRTIVLSITAAAVIIAGVLIKINMFSPANPHLKRKQPDTVQIASPTENLSVDINGKWSSQQLTNPFDEHDKYKIEFDLKVLNDIVVGNLRMVSTVKGNDYNIKKGFLDGRIKDNIISFYTVEQSVNGSEMVSFKNIYHGSVSKDDIKFSLESDRPWGFPGQEFIAKRSLPLKAGK